MPSAFERNPPMCARLLNSMAFYVEAGEGRATWGGSNTWLMGLWSWLRAAMRGAGTSTTGKARSLAVNHIDNYMHIYRLMTSALSWSWSPGLPPSTPPLMPMTSTWSEQATAVASFIGFFLPPALIGHSTGSFILDLCHNPNYQGLPNSFLHDLCALAWWLLLDNSRHDV